MQQSTAVGKPSPRNLTTNAKPSSEITANAAPPSFVGRSSGVAKQTGAGAHKTKGPQQIATQGGRSHIGRSDGYMQQVDLASSAGAGAQKTKKLKGSATNAAGGSPAVQLNRFSNTTFKPTTVGRPTTVGDLGTSPAPKKVVWSHNAGSLSNRPMLNDNIQRPSGASQGQGKPAGGGMASGPAMFRGQSAGKFQKGQGAYAQPETSRTNDQHVQKTKPSQQVTTAGGRPVDAGTLLDKPTFGEKFKMSAGGKKNGEKVSPTSGPR